MKNDNKKKNVGLVSAIVITVVIVVFLGGYYFINKDAIKNKTDKHSKDEFKYIVRNELSFLTGLEKLNDLNNYDYSFMMYNLYDKKDQDSFNVSELENIKKNSSLRYIDFDYADIRFYDDFGINSTGLNNDIVNYELKDGVYKKMPIGVGLLRTVSFMYDDKLEKKDNKYIFTCKYVIARDTDDMSYNLYYSTVDINDDFYFNTIKTTDNIDNDIKSYLDENIDMIRNKLYTYTYVFKIKKKNIVLEDYYRTKRVEEKIEE